MEGEFRYFTMGNTELKVFRNGALQYLFHYKNGEKLWKDKKSGKDTNGYLQTGIDTTLFFVHNIIALCYLGEKPEGKQTDHINSIKTDNRVENLQYITRSENCMKKTTCRGKPIKGFSKTKNGKYRASICKDKKQKYLGIYATEEEAIKIYIKAKAVYLSGRIQSNERGATFRY